MTKSIIKLRNILYFFDFIKIILFDNLDIKNRNTPNKKEKNKHNNWILKINI